MLTLAFGSGVLRARMGVGDVIGIDPGNQTSTACRNTLDMGFVLTILKLLVLGEQWLPCLQLVLILRDSLKKSRGCGWGEGSASKGLTVHLRTGSP